jgi:hypothetical protein
VGGAARSGGQWMLGMYGRCLISEVADNEVLVVVCMHRVLLLLALSACMVNGKCGCCLWACFALLYLLRIYG